MQGRHILLALSTLPIIGVAAGFVVPPVQFEITRMFIEFNSSAEDIGVQVFLDGDPWRRVKIVNPNGVRLLEVESLSDFRELGLTELFFESNEPEIVDLPIADFLDKFPAGAYRFSGRSVEGEEVRGTATFTHVIPDGPVILTPGKGEIVDENDAVISWEPVADPPGSVIRGYQLIVETGPFAELQMTLSANTTSVRVPPEFLHPGRDYKFEVLSIETGGNQTITEGTFSTAP